MRLSVGTLRQVVKQDSPITFVPQKLTSYGGLEFVRRYTIAELKGEFALDVVPTRHYTANCAWQQLSVLAYNVARSFQLELPRFRGR
jgi:hypothetical protein